MTIYILCKNHTTKFQENVQNISRTKLYHVRRNIFRKFKAWFKAGGQQFKTLQWSKVRWTEGEFRLQPPDGGRLHITPTNCAMLKMEINDICSLHVLCDYKVLAQFCNLETNFIKQVAVTWPQRGYSYLIQKTVSTIQTSANFVHQKSHMDWPSTVTGGWPTASATAQPCSVCLHNLNPLHFWLVTVLHTHYSLAVAKQCLFTYSSCLKIQTLVE
jgi:hypothetical protein